jgi:hypothetical protein
MADPLYHLVRSECRLLRLANIRGRGQLERCLRPGPLPGQPGHQRERASAWGEGVVTDTTDLVVARDRETGEIAFGLNGDRGPASKIGEGSIAFTAALSKTELSGTETYAEIKKLARPDVDYLIFPTHDVRKMVGGRFSQADIDRLGSEIFQKWGGESRLLACGALNH